MSLSANAPQEVLPLLNETLIHAMPTNKRLNDFCISSMTGGSLHFFRSCCLFYAKLTMLLIICMRSSRTNAEAGKTEMSLSGKLSANATLTAQMSEKSDETASIPVNNYAKLIRGLG
ncbi:MAG: hypothetical protein ACXWUC_10540 [Methylosarcina sp.]